MLCRFFTKTSSGRTRPNDEDSIASLSNGQLLLAWTRFLRSHDHSSENRGSGSRDRLQRHLIFISLWCHSGMTNSPAEIQERFSDDGGFTWGEPVLCTTEPGFYNTLNDTLLQMRGGRVVQPAATTR